MESNGQRVIPISLGMVNVFIIKGERIILVDTGLPGSIKKIQRGLSRNGIRLGDISLIVVTHNHADHVGSLKKLKEITGAKVVVHKKEAEGLRYGKSTEVKPTNTLIKLLMKFIRNSVYEGVEADIIVKDELSLDEFGVRGKLIHTPGHTPGSLSVVLDNGEMIVGDLISCKRTGGRGKASKPIFATDMGELKETLRGIVKMSPGIIYSSHGVTCQVDAVNELISKL